jgi:hypothetical protein
VRDDSATVVDNGTATAAKPGQTQLSGPAKKSGSGFKSFAIPAGIAAMFVAVAATGWVLINQSGDTTDDIPVDSEIVDTAEGAATEVGEATAAEEAIAAEDTGAAGDLGVDTMPASVSGLTSSIPDVVTTYPDEPVSNDEPDDSGGSALDFLKRNRTVDDTIPVASQPPDSTPPVTTQAADPPPAVVAQQPPPKKQEPDVTPPPVKAAQTTPAVTPKNDPPAVADTKSSAGSWDTSVTKKTVKKVP